MDGGRILNQLGLTYSWLWISINMAMPIGFHILISYIKPKSNKFGLELSNILTCPRFIANSKIMNL